MHGYSSRSIVHNIKLHGSTFLLMVDLLLLTIDRHVILSLICQPFPSSTLPLPVDCMSPRSTLAIFISFLFTVDSHISLCLNFVVLPLFQSVSLSQISLCSSLCVFPIQYSYVSLKKKSQRDPTWLSTAKWPKTTLTHFTIPSLFQLPDPQVKWARTIRTPP